MDCFWEFMPISSRARFKACGPNTSLNSIFSIYSFFRKIGADKSYKRLDKNSTINPPQVLTDYEVNTVDYSFGNWVRRRRKALDLTQQELAKKVGCSLSAIFKIESDERRPSRQIAELLARYLEIPSEQYDLFLKVARREKGFDQLEAVPPLSGLELAPISQPLKTNLPFALTSLIGREHELHTIIQQIQDPICRLLTLTGPGGVGKTRLAIEVARRMQMNFKDDVYFISFAGVADHEYIVSTTANALGLTFSGPIDQKTQVFNYLRNREALLIFDNLEHLISDDPEDAGSAFVSDLLHQSPHVKVIATSREQLRLQAEWIFELQGLPVPQDAQTDEIESNSAAELFIQRARQYRTGFVLTETDRSAVMRICQLVEGLPLAIELAAAWVRTLSCPEIAQEIEKGLGILAATARDLPERHRSMTTVFDYSWKLLSKEERNVLKKLSVFRGGFTREAADNVASASLSLLSALVAKSLIRYESNHRYYLHELVRQYAANRLCEDALEENVAQDRHAAYYLTLLEIEEPLLQSRRQKEALAQLDSEIDNIRLAWELAVAHQQIDLIYRASWSMWYFYELRNYFREGETLFQRGAEMIRKGSSEPGLTSSTQERARVEGTFGTLEAYQAFFCLRQYRNEAAVKLFHSSTTLLRSLNEPARLAFALAYHGVVYWRTGSLGEASHQLQESLTLCQTREHRWQRALFTTLLGAVTHEHGKYGEAYRLLNDSLMLCRSLGDPRLITFTVNFLSLTAQVLDLMAEVQDALQEGLDLATETGDIYSRGLMLKRLAVAAQSNGHYAEARRLFEESLTIFHKIGDRWRLSQALHLLGQLELVQRNLVEAQRLFMEAFKIARDGNIHSVALEVLTSIAAMRAQERAGEQALELVMFILQHPACPYGARDCSEHLRQTLEAQLTRQQAEAAYSRARVKTLDEIVEGIFF
jgi:predicted ATPase/transcriptional regulator with XRE-family HTH domain